MGGTETVVFAFGTFGESRQPAALAKGPNLVPTGRQNLMGISLVSNVPDQPVARRIEEVVQGDGQFDHPKTRPEMPTGDGHRADRLVPQLVRQLPEVFFLEAAQIRRTFYSVEQWSGYGHDRNYMVANCRCGEPRDPNLRPSRATKCMTNARSCTYQRTRPLPLGAAAFVGNVLNSRMVHLVQWPS